MTAPPTVPTALTGAERFDAAARALGIAPEIRVFDRSTRTADEAAAAIGCPVAAIAKSLVFAAMREGSTGPLSPLPVLAVVSGRNRVDPDRLAGLLAPHLGDCRIGKADAGWVRDATGYAIGGVAPIGHRQAASIVLDADLLALDPIWAAAGTPNRVARFDARDLARLTGATVGDIAASA